MKCQRGYFTLASFDMRKSQLFFWFSFYELLNFSLLVLCLAAQTPAFSSGEAVVPGCILVQVTHVEKHVKHIFILKNIYLKRVS